MKGKKRRSKKVQKENASRSRHAHSGWQSGYIRLAFVLGALFLILTAIVYKLPHLLIPLDALVRDLVSPLQTYGWVQLFLAITELGGGVGIISVAIAFSALARLSPAQIIRFAAILTAAAVVTRIVKGFTERVRPEVVLWLEPISAFSFPSGHAATAGALYGFVAWYLYRRTGRLLLALIPLTIALLVGMSRIVLGAHHFSDVIGGFLLAAAIVYAAAAFPFEKLVKKYG